MSSKRIALLFAGHVRNDPFRALENHRQMLNIPDGYSLDIYVATWNNKGQHSIPKDYSLKPSSSWISSEKYQYFDDIKNAFQPTDLTVLDYTSWVEETSGYAHKVVQAFRSDEVMRFHTCLGQFHCIEEGFNLIQKYQQQNNFSYELVVRTRFDLEYEHPVNLGHFIQEAPEVLTFTRQDAQQLIPFRLQNKGRTTEYCLEYVNDRVFLGSPETFAWLAHDFTRYLKSAILNDDYLANSSLDILDHRKKLQNEVLASNYLWKKGVNVQSYPFPWRVIR